MSIINIFSVVLLAIIFFYFIKYKSNIAYKKMFSLCLTFYLTTNSGYFISLGGVTIDYYRFLLYFTGLISLLKIGKIKRKYIYSAFGLLSSILLGLVLCYLCKYQLVIRSNGGWDAYLFGYNSIGDATFGSTNIKIFLDAFFSIVICIYIKKYFTWEEWSACIYYSSRVVKFVLVFGIFEFITVYLLNQLTLSRNIVYIFLGTAQSTFDHAISRGNGYMLQGLFREPSQYARGLFLMVLLLIVDSILNKRKNIKWIAVSIMLMIMSMSFTSVILLAFLIIVFTVYECNKNPRIKPIIKVGSVSICVVFVFILIYLTNSDSYYGSRISNSFLIIKELITSNDFGSLYMNLRGFMEDGSSILRLGSSYANIAMQLSKNVFFGIGVGNSVTFSYTSDFITDLGFVGVFFYLKIFIMDDRVTKDYVVLLIGYFVVNLFTCITQTFGLDIIFVFYSLSVIASEFVKVKQQKLR